MSRYRWSENDYNFGPFVYAKDRYSNLALVLGSGDDEDYSGCRLRIQAFGHTLIINLPAIIKPWKKVVVVPEWRQDGTAARLGRDFYYDSHERDYGFSYGASGSMGDGGFLQVFYGYDMNSGPTHQRWSCFTPWNNWRFVRHSLYDLEGNLYGKHWWTEEKLPPVPVIETIEEAREFCPWRIFSFTDFDGEQLTAKTRIEEREWRLGTGWFRWLSHFKKPIIHRSLDIDFSGETGRRKGSWNGGTTGHSIEMLPGELHEAAFRRYCDGQDRHEKPRDMKLIGEVS